MALGEPDLDDLPATGGQMAVGPSARVRVGVAGLAGLCTGVAVSVPVTWQLGTLIGWDVAAVVYVTWTWLVVWRLDADATARLAVREDPGRAVLDATVLVAAVASLFAVALVMAASEGGGGKTSRGVLAVTSVVLSWSVVHTVFTSRYARLYYSGPDGGVDFKQKARPRYSDFAYLAFTVGMTFQVSDTDLNSAEMRATVLRHSLLSYMMGAVVIATMINLVAGLAK